MKKKSELTDIPKNFKNALIKKTQRVHPFWSLLGMELIDIKKGWAIVKLPFDQKLTQSGGNANVGSIFSLADSAMGMALLGMVDRRETFVTLEMKISYLKPFAKGIIFAEALIIKKSSETAVAEVEIATDSGEIIAKGLGTCMILENKK